MGEGLTAADAPFADGVYDIELDELEQTAVATATGHRYDVYVEPERCIDRSRDAGALLPEPLRSMLEKMRHGDGPPVVRIRGLPIPPTLQPTPIWPFASTERTMVGTEPMLLTLALLIGEPFTYAQWDGGDLIHNKYPIAAHRDVQYGSNAVEFLVHTETPFRRPSPSFLLLLCLRADPSGAAATRLCPIIRLLDELAPDLVEELRRPAYAFLTDNHQMIIRGNRITAPEPIISLDSTGRTRVEYVADMVAIDERAEAALQALHEWVTRRTIDVFLDVGDLLVIDNRRAAHGRSAVSPRYDGNDRWLQRVLLLDSDTAETGPGRRQVNDPKYLNYPTDYQMVLDGRSGRD